MKMNSIVKMLLVCGICVASVACQSKKSAEAAAPVQEVKKPKVTTAVVNMQDVDQQSVFTGNVEGHTVNNITPQQPRRIARLLVDVGDRVYAGQKLAEMENSALAQAKAQYENNKANFERSQELYNFGGESKANYEAMKTAYEVSKFTYENMLENTTLLSPISGVVTARNYDNGDMVAGMPIFVVQRINPVKIFVNVSESLYTHIKKGMVVDVELDALPEQKFEGKVSRITPMIDPQTRTFEVEITVANGKELIKPGMYARVVMNYGTRKSVVVPDVAVVKQLGSGSRYIYVYKADGTVAYQKVELGRRIGNEFEVLSGVEDGEFLVTKGHMSLTNGCKVELVK